MAVLLLALGIGIAAEHVIAPRLQPNLQLLQKTPGLTDDQNDESVLNALRDKGSDLTKPTDIVYYLYIPSLRDARTAASTLRESKFSPKVENPLGQLPDGSYESRYSVVAHVEAVPSMENLRRLRSLCKGLARRYGGEYDGWEAAVVTR